MKQLLWISIIALATTSDALAQPADAPPAVKIALARQLYEQGIDAAGKGRWSVAYQRFKASYELAPRVLTLFNLAFAQGQTGHIVEASEAYHHFLRETSDGRYPDLRNSATGQLDLLDKQIARLVLDVSNVKAGDVIAIDDVELPQAALHEPIPLDPGQHVARIQRGTTLLATRTIALAIGASESLHIALPATAPDLQLHRPLDAAPAGAPDFAAPATDHHAQRSWLRSPWLWAAIAVAAAGGGIGVYMATRTDGVAVR